MMQMIQMMNDGSGSAMCDFYKSLTSAIKKGVSEVLNKWKKKRIFRAWFYLSKYQSPLNISLFPQVFACEDHDGIMKTMVRARKG